MPMERKSHSTSEPTDMLGVSLSSLPDKSKRNGETPSLMAFNQLLEMDEAFRSDDSVLSSAPKTELKF